MFEFVLPGAPPLLLNSRLHWRKANKQKIAWYEVVRLATLRQIPKVPFEAGCIRYIRCCGNMEPDYDNLVSGFKWITDGLIRAGLFEDDTQRHLEIEYLWASATPKSKRIIVQMVPILQPERTRTPQTS